MRPTVARLARNEAQQALSLKERRSNATSAGIPGIPDRYRSASIVITRELHTDEA
jgi:hypothetical protein